MGRRMSEPGGEVWPGLALCDAIELVDSPVYTIARQPYSMGAIILAAGGSQDIGT